MLALRRALFMGAFLAAAFLTSGARAASVVGSQALSALSLDTDSTDLAAVTKFDVTESTVAGGVSQTGDFNGLSPQVLDAATLLTSSLSTFSFASADFGTFTADFGQEIASPENTRTFYFSGTFTAGSDQLFSGETDQTTASFLLNLTQSGGPDNAISWSGTLNAPAVAPPTVPEPASLVMAGVPALLGLLAWRKRRASSIS